jgi:hypothetical protein
MSGGRLTALQRRILRALARLEPPWTLSGGGALVGFHLGHRETRDLDLFWRERGELGELLAEAPVEVLVEGSTIAVDTRRELLASKIATLLERSEIRDLADVKALLDSGADLDAGLRDAPAKDAGFSPLTLAWVLKSYDTRPAAQALGLSESQAKELEAFRHWLIDRITRVAAPEWTPGAGTVHASVLPVTGRVLQSRRWPETQPPPSRLPARGRSRGRRPVTTPSPPAGAATTTRTTAPSRTTRSAA